MIFNDCSAPLGLLFTLSQPYIRRIDVDGTNSVSLYSSGNPFAVDYDYRCKGRLSLLCITYEFDTPTGIIIYFGLMLVPTESGELNWMDQIQ